MFISLLFVNMESSHVSQDLCCVWFVRSNLTDMFASGASILQLRPASHMFIHQYIVV
jgi:hypothetical protein